MLSGHHRSSDRRRRLSLALLGVWVIVAGSVGVAQSGQPAQSASSPQYPIFNTDHLNSAMKTVGLAFGLARTSALANDPQNAKDYLIRARDQLATTITFWRGRKIDDAVSTLRDTLKRMDALDVSLSADQVDAAEVKRLIGEIGAGCQTCHAKYREQDPATKAYRVKLDLVR